jgi:hypothetical protein
VVIAVAIRRAVAIVTAMVVAIVLDINGECRWC